MRGDIGKQEGRNGHIAAIGRRFGRTGDERATSQLNHGDANRDDASVCIDGRARKRGEFAPAQRTEHREQDEQPVAAVSERVGQGEDLSNGQDRALWRVLLTSAVDSARVALDQPVVYCRGWTGQTDGRAIRTRIRG